MMEPGRSSGSAGRGGRLAPPVPERLFGGLFGRRFGRDNADEAPARPVVFELHPSGDLRKERVVLAEADVQARTELPSALANEDGAARHDVAVEPLHAETLRVAVAAVA